METDQILASMKSDMQSALDFALREFSAMHTGKASPEMVESVPVEVPSYGSTMQLRDLAAVTTPDARTISIQPWDKGVIRDVEKALQKANLGMNPIIQGDLIRLHLPELSRERRQELVKMVAQHAEEGRVGVRKARREAMDQLKESEKQGDISEDDLHRLEKEVQKATDQFVDQIGKALETKEKELLSMG